MEGGEEGFAEDGVEEEGFERGGEVGVEAVDAEGFVVREVVRLWVARGVVSYRLACVSGVFEEGGFGVSTLKAALYGIPMGRLAITANNLFAIGDLKARLCDISWMARKRFWFAVAPMM